MSVVSPIVTIGVMEAWVKDLAGDGDRAVAAAVRHDLAAEGFDVADPATSELVESAVSATLSNLFESFTLRLEMAVADDQAEQAAIAAELEHDDHP